MSQLDVVIPTYDNWEAVGRLLQALRACTHGDWAAIIVENGSVARGWTKPVNQGMRATHAEIVVVINDDCQPQDGWDVPLRQAIDDGAWVACPYWEGHEFTGHCFAMSREAVQHLFPLDERFVFWQSDALLLDRLKATGRHPVRVDSSVLHDYGDALRTSNRAAMAETIQGWITQDDLARHSAPTRDP